METTELKELPNPNIHREPCVENCEGCQKTYPIRLSEKSVCICYQEPKTKWRNFKIEPFQVGDKKYEAILNPCPMATHMSHTPKEAFFTASGKLNPIKASKRS